MKKIARRDARCTKVNLGSGPAALEGWINIDNSLNARLAQYPLLRLFLHRLGVLPKSLYEVPWSEHVRHLIVRDVRRKLPFDSATVDYIYTSHLIEHLTVNEAERMVSECFRVPKPGGVIRIVTPDLELMAMTYLREMEAFSYGNSVHFPARTFLEIVGVFRTQAEHGIAFKFDRSRHKWLYDKYTLKDLLERCGFTDIKKMAYREGVVSDLEQLDNRPEESLYMEATKPYAR